jgi:hypothetical protein
MVPKGDFVMLAGMVRGKRRATAATASLGALRRARKAVR